MTCPESRTHLSVFLLGGDTFWARYYRFISSSNKQLAVKPNTPGKQAVIPLVSTEGNRIGSSEPQGTRIGSSEPQETRIGPSEPQETRIGPVKLFSNFRNFG